MLFSTCFDFPVFLNPSEIKPFPMTMGFEIFYLICLADRIMPSTRSLPSPGVQPSEMLFLSREWLDGNLERPERPVNPVPPHDGTILPTGSFDRLVASFQHFHVGGASVSASNSGTTIEEVSSSGSDSGLVKLPKRRRFPPGLAFCIVLNI